MDQDVLQITTAHDGGISTLGLAGELDSMNVGELTDAVSRLLDTGHRLFVLDLSGLEFIDSAGLGGLVGLWERSLERGSFMALAALSPRVHEVLQITGLSSVFQTYPTVEEARQAVRATHDAFPAKTDATA